MRQVKLYFIDSLATSNQRRSSFIGLKNGQKENLFH